MSRVPTFAIVLSLAALAGCAQTTSSRRDSRPIATRADALNADNPDIRRTAIRALGRSAGPGAVARLTPLLADDDPSIAAEAAFALGITQDPDAPGALMGGLPADAPLDVVDAGALGLGYQKGASAEAVLVALMARDDLPPSAPGAMFSYYRWRGSPAPTAYPGTPPLGYATSKDAARRAGFGHLARAVKDARFVPALSKLLRDDDWEVRRGAALGLAQSTKTPWSAAVATTALGALRGAAKDLDPRVMVAVCRALSSYDHASVVAPLLAALAHKDFNVRAAAAQSLARRKAAGAADDLERLAKTDPSVSVRAESATALTAIDAKRAQGLVDALLADEAEFVRASACGILGAAEGDAEEAAIARLIELAESDPHVRVRHTALGSLEGKQGDAVTAALRRAIEKDQDPVVVAVACGTAAANGLEELADAIVIVTWRFLGMKGADARESAIDALATLGRPDDRGIITALLEDENPSVAWAAEKALAKYAGMEAPEPRRAGVRGVEQTDVWVEASSPIDMVLHTSRGAIRLRLDPEQAPLHVAHVLTHALAGGYDGLTWHRVVPDFVIQGGCPRGDGSGSAGVSLPLEPTRIVYERGVLGMPRSGHPDSGGCQLFIMHSRAPHLDLHYTAFGRVVEGLDVVDLLDVDDRIERVTVEPLAR